MERVGALRKVAGGERHKFGGSLASCHCGVSSSDLPSSSHLRRKRRYFYFLSSFDDRDVTRRGDVINLTIDFIPDLPSSLPPSLCATSDDDKGRPASRQPRGSFPVCGAPT